MTEDCSARGCNGPVSRVCAQASAWWGVESCTHDGRQHRAGSVAVERGFGVGVSLFAGQQALLTGQSSEINSKKSRPGTRLRLAAILI